MSVGVTFVGDGSTMVSGSGGGIGEDEGVREGEAAAARSCCDKWEFSEAGSWFSSRESIMGLL